MDNFRKFKAPHSSRRNAVDGFVGGGQRNARLTRRASISDHKQNVSGRLDNFDGPDGFRANSQSRS